MRDLVELAEKREAACKTEISELLASRSTMYEASPTRSSGTTSAAATAAPPPEPAADAEEGEMQDDEYEETVEAAAAKIEEAEKQMEAAQVRGVVGPTLQGSRADSCCYT